jgi:hypothetical protein
MLSLSTTLCIVFDAWIAALLLGRDDDGVGVVGERSFSSISAVSENDCQKREPQSNRETRMINQDTYDVFFVCMVITCIVM